MISFAVTAKLICNFGFAYAYCWFSHAAAHLVLSCPAALEIVYKVCITIYKRHSDSEESLPLPFAHDCNKQAIKEIQTPVSVESIVLFISDNIPTPFTIHKMKISPNIFISLNILKILLYIFLFVSLVCCFSNTKENSYGHSGTWHFCETSNRHQALSYQYAHVMHQSIVITAPHLWGRVGDSQAKVPGNYFFYCPRHAGTKQKHAHVIYRFYRSCKN